MSDQVEYNPNILGFLEGKGPVVIFLKEAREIYGQLPSDYNFVPKKKGRQTKMGLNLAIGKRITETLKDRKTNLKKAVYDFFQKWHRDYRNEFGVRIEPFFNLNDPIQVREILKSNREKLMEISRLDLRHELAERQLIRKDILNSIEERLLSVTAERILTRKLKQFHSNDKALPVRRLLECIRAKRIIKTIKKQTGFDLAGSDYGMLAVYADEIAKGLAELARHIPIAGIDNICTVEGQGVEFEFATRDFSYLMLGKETGDCTADKSNFQADRDIENIYWTVFPWILDRNYQILKVYYHGNFVMKAHLLPLFILREDGGGDMALAVDAVETVRAFRDDIEGYGREDLLENREYIFKRLIGKIEHIGSQMGIDHIYAEKFSNTRWVREHLDTLPEIFLHVDTIIKLDELEDVFCLAQELCGGTEYAAPNSIFMELQMKNTSLLPRISERAAGVKPFAIIKGSPDDGIEMKRVIGI